MQQATDLVAAARKNRRALIEADHDALLAELAASPATASLLTALVDLMRDARRRGATQSGGGQLLVVLAKDGPRCGADLASALHLFLCHSVISWHGRRGVLERATDHARLTFHQTPSQPCSLGPCATRL